MIPETAKSATLLKVSVGIGLAYTAIKVIKLFNRQRFRGKTVIITGGATGLGLALAHELGLRGARVAICGRDQNNLETAERQLKTCGYDVFSFKADLRNEEEAQAMVRAIFLHFGRVDALINNAGVMNVGPENVMDVQDFKNAMDSNTWSALHCIKAATPYFRAQGAGRIANVSSIGGKIAVPHMLPYSVSKFAMRGLSLGMSTELSKDGITVTTVVLGLMRTGSPRNVDIKGNHQAEYAWFKIADSLPVMSMDAKRAAQRIADGMERGDAEIILTLPAKAIAAVQGIFPSMVTQMLRLANLLLPRSHNRISKKGYESESVATRKGIARRADAAAAEFNQLD